MKVEIGRTLEVGTPFLLDVANVITGRTFIASITRFGKSWTTRKTVEECFGHAGIIIVDPEGEYISLREKYPLLIIGKDIPLQLETAEFMADKILEAKVSVIIDLSTTEEELGKEYLDKLLKRFFFLETTVRMPYLIVVEEAEDFIPEKGIATATCLDVFRNIAKKGGKRGLGLMVIAHRPAWVSKGVLSQCENKAIGRMDWPSDLNVIEEYLRIPHATVERLPGLGRGEFFFAGDWVETPVFAKVGQVKTTHLGFTPDVIPPSPKELQAVITGLQKALPEVIEKIRPTVVPIDELKGKIKAELEEKYKDRIQSVQRTADEKAERKFKAKIDELQEHVEKLSRSQTLQPTSPISDVLEHPIVKTRMLELSDKARDLLTRIEREQGLTREQLAAFLTTSTNSIASTVETVNKVFHASVIVGEGKPLRYRSMLKRLFITDVGKREIEELERLQNALREKTEIIDVLQPQVIQLRRENNDLNVEFRKTKTVLDEVQSKVSYASAENEKLKNQVKELELMGKAGEALEAAVNQILDHRLKDNPTLNASQKPLIDEQKVTELIEKRFATLDPIATTTGSNSTAVGLQKAITVIDVPTVEKLVTINTESMRGKVLSVAKKGKLETWRRLDDIVKAVEEERWSATPQEVNNALNDLEKQDLIAKKHTDRNYYCLANGVTFAKEAT